jgi:hypothetical protein
MLFGEDAGGIQYGTIGGLQDQLRELREVRKGANSNHVIVCDGWLGARGGGGGGAAPQTI